MAEGLELADQAIRIVEDWKSLPKGERDSLALEIAAAARYWNQTREERRRFQRAMKTRINQWRSENSSSD
jgi:hypothetical protein